MINKIVAKLENPSVGEFRVKPVLITGTQYMPPMDMLLGELFREMVEDFNRTSNFLSDEKLNFESTFNLFLDTTRNQYFEDRNKRTGQLMMNGVLVQSGYAPFTVTPSRDTEFREKLLSFYESGDKNDMIDFIYSSINSPRLLVMQQELERDFYR